MSDAPDPDLPVTRDPYEAVMKPDPVKAGYHQVNIDGQAYWLREMSGYEFMKIGRTAKGGAEEDVIVEWIVACAMEPKITRDEARRLPAKIWYGLFAEIEQIHGLGGNFQKTISGPE